MLANSWRPAGCACQALSTRPAAASPSSRISTSMPDSTATFMSIACLGSPLITAMNRSRSQPIFCSTARKNSPVPTKSCHLASTSPRRRVPSAVCTATVRTASAKDFSASSRRVARLAACASTASATAGVPAASAPIAPSRVCSTTRLRLTASAASSASQSRIGDTAALGNSPVSSTWVSGTANSGEEPSPRWLIICPRCAGTSPIAAGGTRSSTTATTACRSAAERR